MPFVLCPWHLCRLLDKIRLSAVKNNVLDFSSLLSSFISQCFQAARVTCRALSFRVPLRAISLFSFAAAMFAISFFYRSSLSRSVISPRIATACCIVHTSSFHSVWNHSWFILFETWGRRRNVHRIQSCQEASLSSFVTADSSCDMTSFHDRPVLIRRSSMSQKCGPSIQNVDVTLQILRPMMLHRCVLEELVGTADCPSCRCNTRLFRSSNDHLKVFVESSEMIQNRSRVNCSVWFS